MQQRNEAQVHPSLLPAETCGCGPGGAGQRVLQCKARLKASVSYIIGSRAPLLQLPWLRQRTPTVAWKQVAALVTKETAIDSSRSEYRVVRMVVQVQAAVAQRRGGPTALITGDA